jgi:hypothetical protein
MKHEKKEKEEEDHHHWACLAMQSPSFDIVQLSTKK